MGPEEEETMLVQYLTTPGGLEVVVLKAAGQVVLQRWPGEEFTIVPHQIVDEFLESILNLKQVKVEGRIL